MRLIYLSLISLMTIVLLIQESFSASRVRDEDSHPSVGLIKYGSSIACASFVIKHGVLVTAKHCFSHFDIDEDNFEKDKVKVSFKDVEITGSDVYELILDRGDNDLAYILYNRDVTKDLFKLNHFKLNDYEDTPMGTELFRAGFPQGTDTLFSKVITSGCFYSGQTGYFESMVLDKGYEGLLFDTDCPAWFGDSGGPVYSKEGDTIIIHGVLSHTFEVDFAGNLMEDAIYTDDIGKYVRTSMFSPFTLNKDLDSAISKEEEIFGKKNEVKPIVETISKVPEIIETIEEPISKNDVLFNFFMSIYNFFLKLLGLLS